MNGEPGDSTSWWTLSLVSKLFRPGNDGRVSFFFPKIVTHVHCKDHQTSFKYPTWKTGVLKAQVQLIQNFSFQYVSSALESAVSGWIFAEAEQESSHDSDPSILPCDSSSMRRLQTFTNSLGSSKGRIRANKFFTCQAILMYYSLDFAGVLPLETWNQHLWWSLKGLREPRIKPKNQPTPPLLLSVVALGLGAWVSHPKCQSQAAWIPFRTQLNPPTNIHLHYPTSIHLTCANSQTGFMDMQSLVSNKTYIIGNLASLTMYSNYFEYTFFMVNKWLQYL